MSKVKDKILNKIKEIEPRPNSYFVFRRVVLWLLVVVSVTMTAMAMAVVLYALVNGEWHYYSLTHNSVWQYLVDTLPYLWLFLALLFLALSLYRFRKTEGGYRYRVSVVVVFGLLGCIVVGLLGFLVGVGAAVDRVVANSFAWHDSVDRRVMNRWQDPEAGRISGVIRGWKEKRFLLEDMRRGDWQVVLSEAILSPAVDMDSGELVRVLGYVSGDDRFSACLVVPMRLSGMGDLYRFLAQRPKKEDLEVFVDKERGDLVRVKSMSGKLDGERKVVLSRITNCKDLQGLPIYQELMKDFLISPSEFGIPR